MRDKIHFALKQNPTRLAGNVKGQLPSSATLARGLMGHSRQNTPHRRVGGRPANSQPTQSIQARRLRRGVPRVGCCQGSPPYTFGLRTTGGRSFFTEVASK